MSVRNCGEIGENLQKIMNRLLSNQELLKLLYYTDKDPLSKPDLTDEQKATEIFEKLIKVIPKVNSRETSNSVITIEVVKGIKNTDNSEFKNLSIAIELFIPLTQWIIKDTNLRPFAILGQIEKSLNNKTINGLGKMTGGQFYINFYTDDIACYKQEFEIITYD